VIVLDPTSKVRRIVKVLDEGSYVGEVALVYKIKRSTNVEAFTWTRLHILTRHDFQLAQQAYPEDAVIIQSEIRNFISGQNYTFASSPTNKAHPPVIESTDQPAYSPDKPEELYPDDEEYEEPPPDSKKSSTMRGPGSPGKFLKQSAQRSRKTKMTQRDLINQRVRSLCVPS